MKRKAIAAILALTSISPNAHADEYVCKTVCVMEITGSTTITREMTDAELQAFNSRQPVISKSEAAYKAENINTVPYNPMQVEHYEQPIIPTVLIPETSTVQTLETATATTQNLEAFNYQAFLEMFMAWFQTWFAQFLATWGK